MKKILSRLSAKMRALLTPSLYNVPLHAAVIALALCAVPSAHAADLILRGNGSQQQPPTRGMPAALTNNVASPGFPALFRATVQPGLTNHFIIGTNGGLAFRYASSNYVGYTGIVTQFNGTVSFYFVNGVLCLTNNSPSTNFLGQTIP